MFAMRRRGLPVSTCRGVQSVLGGKTVQDIKRSVGDFDWQKTPLLQGADAAIERLRQKFQQAFVAADTIDTTPTLDALQKQLNDAAEAFDRMKRERQRNAEAMNQAGHGAAANGQGNGGEFGGQKAPQPPQEMGKQAKGTFAFAGLEEFAKHIQQSVSAKDPAIIAQRQLDVNKQQLAIMQREEQARKMRRGVVPVFG